MNSERFDFRWGLPELDDAGELFVYGFMLRSYSRLGLTHHEMMCLLHLAAYHYNSPRGEAAPSLATVAEHMGYEDARCVRRLVSSLRRKKMLDVQSVPGRPSIYNARQFAKAALELDRRRANAPGESAKECHASTPDELSPLAVSTPDKTVRSGTDQTVPTPRTKRSAEDGERRKSEEGESRPRPSSRASDKAISPAHADLRDALQRLTGRNIDWQAKRSREVLAKLVGAGATAETVDGFLVFWKTQWQYHRDRQLPSLPQVWEYWPQASSHHAEPEWSATYA